METTTRKTWKPVTAGIFNILAGAFSAFWAIIFIIAIILPDFWIEAMRAVPSQQVPFMMPLMNAVMILLIVLAVIGAIFPIVSGVFSIQRRGWVLTLLGSIVAILAAFPLGVASTVFVAMSKDEFE